VSFRQPPELRREFDRFCNARRRPASEVAREAISRHMLNERLRRLRSELRPYAEAQGLLTEVDFFRAVVPGANAPFVRSHHACDAGAQASRPPRRRAPGRAGA